VRTSAEYHPLYIQNLKFLQDFWVHPFHVEAEQEAQVLEALSTYPGVSVAALLDAHPGLPVDVVWAMLTSQRIFTDLSASDLMNWDQVFLYQSCAESEASSRSKHVPQATPLASRLLWDGRLWEAEVEATTVVLRPEIGAVFSLSYEQFQHLVNQALNEQSCYKPQSRSFLRRHVPSVPFPVRVFARHARLFLVLLEHASKN
jgi:putative transposase